MEQSKFWDRFAARYAKQPVADEATYQRKLAMTRAHLRPDMQVVEFGCGTGSTALVHAPHVRRIRAFDTSAKMIGIARAKAEEAGIGNVDFEHSDLLDAAIDDGSVDVVLGMSILHLLDDRAATIARVHRILKPGGIFVTSTVCMGETMAYFRFIAPIGNFLGLMPMVRVFTIDALVTELERAGFDLEERFVQARTVCFAIARKGSGREARPVSDAVQQTQ